MASIYYNNTLFSLEDFISLDESEILFIQQVKRIVTDWNEGQNMFMLHTSGSTADPKEISFSRKQLKISARQTFEAFNLSKGDSLLCCLSPEHAAGFMMIIRALIYDCDLYLVDPCANPLKDIPLNTKIDFAAFVPYQMLAILNAGNIHNAIINRMKAIILGGGLISEQLKLQLKKLTCPVYHTYGMTETLTHVAIRDIKKNDSSFHALKDVEFGINENDCLIIRSPLNPGEELITQDVVKLINKHNFEWIGRYDHVINSGGIKIHINKLERIIEKVVWRFFPDVRFFISSLKDVSLGEMVVLLIENEQHDQKLIQMMDAFKKTLKSFEIPKKVFFIQNFEYTSLGKIDRLKSLKHLRIND